MENMDKGLTVPKWELINLLKYPKNICPNCLTQDQKIGISMKKASLSVRSPWL